MYKPPVSVFLHSCQCAQLMNYFLSQARFGIFTIDLLFWTLQFVVIKLTTSNYIIYYFSDICPQVVALDVDLPVKQAFHILHEQVSLFCLD